MFFALAALAACGGEGASTTPDAQTSPDAQTTRTVMLDSSGDVQAKVDGALINAQPGDVLVFAPGTYSFTEELSLSVDRVTLRGEADGVIFDFSGQQAGNANGFSADGVEDLVIENISFVDTQGDAIKVQRATNVTFRKVKVSWTGGPATENGAYGLYPVLSTNILIDECEVKYASDAGIYVGQSSNVVVRQSRAEGNVAGIEIENTDDAEVVGNVAIGNTAGILVFNLPNLQRKTGSRTKVHDNMILSNNEPSFAEPGSVVSYVPAGTGMVLFANDRSEVHNNVIMGNDSVAIVLVSCQTVQILSSNSVRCDTDAEYDSFLEDHYIHDNTITGNGTAPQGFYQIFWTNPEEPLFDVLWDGRVAEGKPENGDICIRDNGDVTYAEVDTGGLSIVSRDPSVHDCARDPLPAIEVTW